MRIGIHISSVVTYTQFYPSFVRVNEIIIGILTIRYHL